MCARLGFNCQNVALIRRVGVSTAAGAVICHGSAFKLPDHVPAIYVAPQITGAPVLQLCRPYDPSSVVSWIFPNSNAALLFSTAAHIRAQIRRAFAVVCRATGQVIAPIGGGPRTCVGVACEQTGTHAIRKQPVAYPFPFTTATHRGSAIARKFCRWQHHLIRSHAQIVASQVHSFFSWKQLPLLSRSCSVVVTGHSTFHCPEVPFNELLLRPGADVSRSAAACIIDLGIARALSCIAPC